MRPPEAAAVALKKLLTQPKAQEGWWGPLLAGEQPCLGWGFVSPGIPTGAWCPHADSPVQPAPRCRCHSPFSRGDADHHQADVHQRATSLCFGKCPSMSPGSSAWHQGAQGAGAGISCCTLAFWPGTPAWHRDSCLAPLCTGPAPNP